MEKYREVQKGRKRTGDDTLALYDFNLLNVIQYKGIFNKISNSFCIEILFTSFIIIY